MEFSDPSLVGVCLMRFDDIQDRPRSGGHWEVGGSLRDRRTIAQAICPVMPDNNASMMVFDLTRSGSILDSALAERPALPHNDRERPYREK